MSRSLTGHNYQHLLIRASAGTGKTYQLSSRYLGLLSDDVPLDRILATTFTRKAAGEILDRLIGRLAEATQDADKRGELARSVGARSLTRATCLGWLEHAMRHLHRLRVSTLDSFFSQLARSFSLELGFPPGWQIVEEWDDARLRSQAIGAVLAQGEPAELRTLLNLLAKGETNRSVSDLLRGTVDDLYTLYLETDAAAWHALPQLPRLSAAELADAVEQLRDLPLANQRMSGAREQDCQRALQGDWEAFIATGLAAKVADGSRTYYKQPLPPELVAIYERLLGHAQAELIGRVALQTEATYALLQRFDAEYQRLKRRHRALRFEDIPRRLIGLSELSNFGRLAFRLDSRLDHLLLDEFQDTAPIQWRVLQTWARHVTATGSGGSFFCVGDVKQAIYGWRGGEAEIFDAIEHQLPGLKLDSLIESYRSAPPIIEAVNRIFQHLPDHPNLGRAQDAVQRWCARFETHTTKKRDLSGFVELVSAPRAAEDQDQTDVTLAFAADRIAELVARAPKCRVGVLARTNKTVGRIIYELRRRGVTASEEGGNPLTDSAAVLTVLSALRLADHPADTAARFHVAHGPLGPVLGLADSADHAQAGRAAGRKPAGGSAAESDLADDAQARRAAGRKPAGGSAAESDLTDDAQARRAAGRKPAGGSAAESDLADDAQARRAAGRKPAGGSAAESDLTDDALSRSVAHNIRRQLLTTGYGPVVYRWAEQLAGHCSPRELSRLEQLVELAYSYDAGATLRADDFVSYVEQARVSAASPAAIRVMTIHQSKGLEFDAVFLPELESGLLGQPPAFVIDRQDVVGPVRTVCRYANAAIQGLMPPAIQRLFEAATDRAVAESLCVLYVAITRAARALHLIVAPSKANERSLPSTYAGLLRVALKDDAIVPPSTTVYQSGDAEWFRKCPELTSGEPVLPACEPVTVALAPLVGPRRRAWESARPSGLEGGTRVGARQILTQGRGPAFLRGRLIHAWFELVTWLDEGRPDVAALRRRADESLGGTAPGELDVDQQMERFQRWLDLPVFAELLSRRRYQHPQHLGFPSEVQVRLAERPCTATVQNERGFALRDGEQLLTGFIDRLVLLHQDTGLAAAEILDFKTDAIRPGDSAAIAERVQYYRPQMEAYRRAVQALTGLPAAHILVALVFVEPGVVCPIA